jgi:hypothetical protein|nr:MAG TPA: type I neck protein [Caudoviricetes sp.]
MLILIFLKDQKEVRKMSKYNELVIEFKNIKELEKKWKVLPQKAEYETNNYIWNKASDIYKKQIFKNMPRSNKNKTNVKNAPKMHAKDTESLDKIFFNLGIKIQTHVKPRSRDFGYLIFPDEGRGKHQKRKGAQEFFNKALESKSNEVIDGLVEHLNKKIEEEI